MNQICQIDKAEWAKQKLKEVEEGLKPVYETADDLLLDAFKMYEAIQEEAINLGIAAEDEFDGMFQIETEKWLEDLAEGKSKVKKKPEYISTPASEWAKDKSWKLHVLLRAGFEIEDKDMRETLNDIYNDYEAMILMEGFEKCYLSTPLLNSFERKDMDMLEWLAEISKGKRKGRKKPTLACPKGCLNVPLDKFLVGDAESIKECPYCEGKTFVELR